MAQPAALEPCRNFEKGLCRYGDRCKFWHNPFIASTQCKHFAAGNCRNGHKCAYLHGNDAKATGDESNAQRNSRRRAPAAPGDAPICPFGANCYRVNPEHLREYRHPSRDALPPKRTLAQTDATDFNVMGDDNDAGAMIPPVDIDKSAIESH